MAARCPRCNSDNVAIVPDDFNEGRASCGCCLFGPLGALLGHAGPKGTKGICQNCGHQWSVEKYARTKSGGGFCAIVFVAVIIVVVMSLLGEGCPQ